jgi:hypothetical protein
MTYHNNLFVGLFYGKPRYAMEYRHGFRQTAYDYNGYVSNCRLFAKWADVRYGSKEKYSKATGQEKHGIHLREVKGVFKDCPLPLKHEAYPVSNNRPVLAEGSPVIDKGKVLPNINDTFAGDAPDLGAYERGQPLPRYGPRPESAVAQSPGTPRRAAR